MCFPRHLFPQLFPLQDRAASPPWLGSRHTHGNHCRHLTASCRSGRNSEGHHNSQTHKQAPSQNQTNGREVPQWRYLPTGLVPLPQGMLQQKPPSLIKSIKSSVLYFKPLHCNPRRGAQPFHLIVSKQIVWLELTKGSFLYLCGNVSKKAGAGHLDSFAQQKKKRRESGEGGSWGGGSVTG